MMTKPTREALGEWLTHQLGKPYVWGGKGEVHVLGGTIRTECFDCSGLVTAGLMAIGFPKNCPKCGLDMKGWHNCRKLFTEFSKLSEPGKPRSLDLAFYGMDEDSVDHVMFVWGDGKVLGACGGNSNCIDPMSSLRKGAKVRFRDSVNYRPDFRGYRELPF